MRSLKDAPAEERKLVRAALRSSGEGVKKDQQDRLAVRDVPARTIRGYRVVVRTRGISVEQSLRKSSNQARRRPKFRDLQKAELFAAAAQNETDTRARVENALDQLVRIFDK